MLELIPSMMNLQREMQSTAPAAERVYIGGEAVVMHLTPSSFAIHHPYSFPERTEHMQEIFSRHASGA